MHNAAEVPKPRACVDIAVEDGGVLRLRRHGNPRGPRLALSHGNGFAIDGYWPFWRLLLDEYDVLVFDMRNHGANPPGRAGGHHWPAFARDMEAVWRALRAYFGDAPVAGVFHSLAAVAALMHALERPGRWAGLVLFDPPVFPRPGHRLQPVQARHMREMAARARRRPPRYRAPEDLARQLAGRFPDWVAGAHAHLARAVLRRDPAPDPAGRAWTLACPRTLEAHVFETNTDETLWPRLARAPRPPPVKLVCGDPARPDQRPPALVGAAMARELGLAYEAIPGTSHFLQLEAPRVCAGALTEYLARLGLAAG